MGSVVADFVTGQPLWCGAPVVAFMLGGPPQHLQGKRHSTVHATECFSLQSLPISGIYSELDKVEPVDEKQLSVRLCLASEGVTSWAAFQEKTQLALGLMHQSTYDELVRRGPNEGAPVLDVIASPRMADVQRLKAADLAVFEQFIEFGLESISVLKNATSTVEQQAEAFHKLMIASTSLGLRFDVALQHSQMALKPPVSLPQGLPDTIPGFLCADSFWDRYALHGPLRKQIEEAGWLERVLYTLDAGGRPEREKFLDYAGTRWELFRLQQALESIGGAFRPSVLPTQGGNSVEYTTWVEFLLASTHRHNLENIQTRSEGLDLTGWRRHADELRRLADKLDTGLDALEVRT